MGFNGESTFRFFSLPSPKLPRVTFIRKRTRKKGTRRVLEMIILFALLAFMGPDKEYVRGVSAKTRTRKKKTYDEDGGIWLL